MGSDILQMVVVLALLMAIVYPLGRYMAAVFMQRRTWLDPVLDPVDNAIYKVCSVNPQQRMGWRGYVVAMLVTNLVMFVLLFVVMELQTILPLNPDGVGLVAVPLALNTAMSFITNTNWQNYGGENTLSYVSQMFAIIFPQFTSAATGLVCGIAFIRGIGGSTNLGNFSVDLTRAITRILLPLSFVFAVLFVALGVPATFEGAASATTLSGHEQVIMRGPVAALASIKHLGTNGGGWFNANSAHPFENPSPITNVLEFLLMAAIPMALIYMLGIMLDRKKQAWTFFVV